VRVRAAEWRPVNGDGWAMVSPDHWTEDLIVVTGVMDDPIDAPADLAAALPDDHSLVGAGGDQLTIVFECSWGESEEIEAWLSAIFPELENPWEVAEALREWDVDEFVMARFPGQSWNLFRMRLAVPVISRRQLSGEWVYGTVIALGRALLVFWFDNREEIFKAAARVDSRARRGGYTGEAPSGSIAELASAYVAEVAQAIRSCAVEATKEVDRWETMLFDSIEEESEVGSPARLAELGALRGWAMGLRGNVDHVTEQINKGQFRNSWSTEGLEPIDESVDQELEAARMAVSRLRSDISDAFEAATSLAIAKQLAASQAQQDRADRLAGTVTRLTAFLLVPTFIAATFGANVELPGHGWVRTAIMVIAMVVGALATFVGLRRRQRS